MSASNAKKGQGQMHVPPQKLGVHLSVDTRRVADLEWIAVHDEEVCAVLFPHERSQPPLSFGVEVVVLSQLHITKLIKKNTHSLLAITRAGGE